MGFDGVQNFPTVGLIDGVFRQNLEETGLGYGLEVDMIGMAHEQDMLTCPYIFTPEDAERMARAGADVLVPHMGLTTKGSIGARTALTLNEAAERVQAMYDAAIAVNPDILVLCHGGPIAEPEDVQYILNILTASRGFSVPPAWNGYPPKKELKSKRANLRVYIMENRSDRESSPPSAEAAQTGGWIAFHYHTLLGIFFFLLILWIFGDYGRNGSPI